MRPGFLVRILKVAAVITVLFVLIGITASSTHGYNEGTGQGHQWILDKALSYLKDQYPEVANLYDLDSFRAPLVSGIVFADHSSTNCEYALGAYEGDCDTIHHYGKRQDIIRPTALNDIEAANPGDVDAPSYSQSLYDLAVKFWPGGETPQLSALPRAAAGWYKSGVFSDTSFGKTYLGGTPLCDYRFGSSECPRWPGWVGINVCSEVPTEDKQTALVYLGWAIHLIQDVSLPYHAKNIANEDHQDYERSVDEKLPELDGELPFPGPNPFMEASTALEIADEVVNQASDTSTEDMDVLVDAAIKATAAIIYMYLNEVPTSGATLSGASDWQINDLTDATAAPAAASNPAGYTWEQGTTEHVVYRGKDNHIYEMWLSPNAGWQYADLTGITAAPAAASDPAGYVWEQDNTEHVVYRGKDNHIYAMWFAPGSGWQYADLTGITAAPAAASNPAGYAWEQDNTEHVVYRGKDNHIYEMWFAPGSGWQYADLTGITAAPAAVSDPAAYAWERDNTAHVVYRGKDNHIYEMWFAPGSGWQYADLTGITAAPAAASDPDGYAWERNNTEHVVYRGKDNHVYEMWFTPGSGWQYKDLSRTACVVAGVRADSNPAGYTWGQDNTEHVIYRGNDNHIYEFWYVSSQ